MIPPTRWAFTSHQPEFTLYAAKNPYFMMVAFGVFWGVVLVSSIARPNRWNQRGLTFLLMLGLSSWVVPLFGLYGMCVRLFGR